MKEKEFNGVCFKIGSLIYSKGLNAEVVAEIINKGSIEKLKNICTVSVERLKNIIAGSEPTVIECILIGQALEKDLAYFYCG